MGDFLYTAPFPVKPALPKFHDSPVLDPKVHDCTPVGSNKGRQL